MSDWMDDLYDGRNGDTFSTVTAVKDQKPTLASERPTASHPSSWGSGREPDPFLPGVFPGKDRTDPKPEGVTEGQALPNDSPTDPAGGNRDGTNESEQIHGTDPGTETTGKKTLRGRLSDTQEKINKRREEIGKRFTKVRTQVEETTGKVADRTRPARKKVAAAREDVDPRNFGSRRWSFLWASCAAWTIGPQFFVACWDRVMIVIGQDQMMSGPEPMGFGVLHGPGRWFRDNVAHHWENGTMGYIVACAAFGILPLVLMAAANTWSQYSKWFLGLAVLGPAVYIVGVSYAGWVLTWEDFYLVTMFGAAWYCTVWLREKKEPGLIRFLLMIPLASVVTGFMLYSPGAVW